MDTSDTRPKYQPMQLSAKLTQTPENWLKMVDGVFDQMLTVINML